MAELGMAKTDKEKVGSLSSKKLLFFCYFCQNFNKRNFLKLFFEECFYEFFEEQKIAGISTNLPIACRKCICSLREISKE